MLLLLCAITLMLVSYLSVLRIDVFILDRLRQPQRELLAKDVLNHRLDDSLKARLVESCWTGLVSCDPGTTTAARAALWTYEYTSF